MGEHRGQLHRDIPATYRICVGGRLDESWSAYLEGMAIRPAQTAAGEWTTVLTGRLVDQAALVGVLNNVYDLGFTLRSVECLECE